MTDPVPRGVRLNNPGNLEHGDPWQGLATDQPDERFCKFNSPAWGFRALAVVLCTYQDKHAVRTIAQAITKWAPGNENDTGAYITAVCRDAHRSPDEPIDFHDYNDAYPVIRAIAIHENGSFEKYFNKAQLDAGCIKAGLVHAPSGSVGAVVKVGATAVAAGAGAAAQDPGALITVYNSIKPIVDVAPHLIQRGFWGIVVAVVLLLGIGEYRKIKAAK